MGSVLSKVSPSAADGAGGSTEGITLDLTPELREEIKVVTNFNDSEVSKLLKLFSTHAGSLDGITKEQFQSIPLLQHSPFNERLFDVMDKDSNGVMSLLEFAQLMSTLSERSSKDQKLRLTFEVYDHDRDGRLSLEDIALTLNKITGGVLSEDEAQQVAGKVLEESGNAGEALAFEDFCKVMMGTEFEKKMSFFR